MDVFFLPGRESRVEGLSWARGGELWWLFGLVGLILEAGKRDVWFRSGQGPPSQEQNLREARRRWGKAPRWPCPVRALALAGSTFQGFLKGREAAGGLRVFLQSPQTA